MVFSYQKKGGVFVRGHNEGILNNCSIQCKVIIELLN